MLHSDLASGAETADTERKAKIIEAVWSHFPEFKTDILKEDENYFRKLYMKRWQIGFWHFVADAKDVNLEKLEASVVKQITALQEAHLEHIAAAYRTLYDRIENKQTLACRLSYAIPFSLNVHNKAIFLAKICDSNINSEAPILIGGPGSVFHSRLPEIQSIKTDLVGWNIPTFRRYIRGELELFDLPLMLSISNTATPTAVRLIEAGVDVNTYSVEYFNQLVKPFDLLLLIGHFCYLLFLSAPPVPHGYLN